MPYSTPALFTSGAVLTATQQNLFRSNEEALAKPPLAWCYSTANQSIANGTNVAMTLSATYALRTCTFASNTITIPETGYYIATIRLQWAANATGTRVARIKINGTESAAAHDVPVNTTWAKHGLTYLFSSGATDTITVEVYQDSGGALNLVSGSSIFVHMMSRI